jgi:serine/threonine-protein kinase
MLRAMSVADTLGIVGSTVDQIRFDECVDAGGFGIVYRGRHTGRDEAVAIKCLRLTRLANLTETMRASIVNRFREETKILHHLSHGTHDIVRCLSSGQLFAPATGEPVPYMVLEWLDGRTLSADLAERRERGLPGRSLRETLDLVESAALAIAHAHTQGIIHRDIKPGNLMLTRIRGGMRLKVLDFGLAKILSEDPGAGRNLATADGVQLFSVAYCAPEQLSSTVGEIGPWTDIYSLALVMLEVMRGEKIRHPTQGSLRASALGISLPRPIEDLLARAVAQDPLERPANASVFWSALRELAQQSVPPVSDASALAATAYDGDVAAAMLRVRAATAGNGATAQQASPFTGTMLMANAPGGALHLLSPQIATKDDSPPAANLSATVPVAPTAGAPPPAEGAQRSGSSSTAPLAMPAPPGALSANAVTKGIALPPSPLASSLGPGVASPVAHLQPPAPAALIIAPNVAPPPRRPPSVPPPHAPRLPSVPPPSLPLAPARSSSAGLVIGVLIVLVLAVAAVAGVMLLRNR